MADNDLLTTLGWDSVRGALAECSVQTQELENFLFAQLDQLEQRFSRLMERERTLHEQSLSAESAAATDQVEAQQQLEQLTAELEHARAQLARLEAKAAQAQAAESDVAILRQELDKAAAQAARMAGMAVELADARAELAANRTQIAELRARQTAGPQEIVADYEKRLREAEEDRRALENELEHIRKRAAEANSALAEHKKREAEERAEWSGELKQLRRALEKQSILLVEQQEAGIVSSARKTVPVPRGESVISDPVVDSVMEQFESLQRDMIKRRQQKGAKNSPQGVAP